MNSDTLTVLQRYKVSDLLPKDDEVRTLCIVDATQTVREAFRTLIDNAVLSAPILGSQGRFLGFLDLRDIVAHAVSLFAPKHLEEEDTESILSDERMFAHTPIAALQDLWEKRPFVPLNHDAPLTELLRVMSDSEVHRVPVMKDNNLWGVVSQFRVIEFLRENLHLCPDLHRKTVASFHLGYKQVISVNENQRAIDAFTIIKNNNIMGLPIVDDERKPVGAISVSDLKAISSSGKFWSSLYLPVWQYVELVKSQTISDVPPLVCCHPEDTIEMVIGMVVTHKVHRLFVVNKHNKLLGVASLWDILQALF